jgi:GDP-mannose transporter
MVRTRDEQHDIQVSSRLFWKKTSHLSFTNQSLPFSSSCSSLSMVGALNKLPVAASGLIFFNDPATTGNVSAIALGFFAGLVYAVAKNNQKKAEAATALREGGGSVLPMSTRR